MDRTFSQKTIKKREWLSVRGTVRTILVMWSLQMRNLGNWAKEELEYGRRRELLERFFEGRSIHPRFNAGGVLAKGARLH